MSKQRTQEPRTEDAVPAYKSMPSMATLRDEMAMSALVGMMASEAMSQGLMKVVPDSEYKLVNAQEAYAWADAMLTARNAQ